MLSIYKMLGSKRVFRVVPLIKASIRAKFIQQCGHSALSSMLGWFRVVDDLPCCRNSILSLKGYWNAAKCDMASLQRIFYLPCQYIAADWGWKSRPASDFVASQQRVSIV